MRKKQSDEGTGDGGGAVLVDLLCHLVLFLHSPVSFSAGSPLIRHSSVSTSLLPNPPPSTWILLIPPISLAASFIHSLPPADAFVPHFFPPLFHLSHQLSSVSRSSVSGAFGAATNLYHLAAFSFLSFLLFFELAIHSQAVSVMQSSSFAP